MTRDRLDLALRHCADLSIDVEWSDLGDFRRGEYRRSANLIVINARLTRAQAASTCGHELGHEKFRDSCSTPANERRAWQYAAALLVRPSEYRRAEQIVGHHPAALALDLGVTPRLIHACTWITRTHAQNPPALTQDRTHAPPHLGRPTRPRADRLWRQRRLRCT